MQQQRGIPRALALLWRGACLRCPRCGARSLFRTWFAMYERCAVCGLRFEREQGYFLGAMYINYGVSVVLALLGPLRWSTGRARLSPNNSCCGSGFVRYSRCCFSGIHAACG